ncbi:hypothetical protein AWE51_08945 [Aquimarina aggregata]|uniref:Uncharacterized protein n=1 Tax=Aquimarina aggregata TaxID=1642818 RepID=A0A162ZFJ8_9FLAO|nr:hypothetical protein AWE51_08945 [Aquimarina aggregata]
MYYHYNEVQFLKNALLVTNCDESIKDTLCTFDKTFLGVKNYDIIQKTLHYYGVIIIKLGIIIKKQFVFSYN